MSRFRVYVALSIDGYIADEDGVVGGSFKRAASAA